jgi:sulfur carrier protein
MRLQISGQWEEIELQEGSVKELLYVKKIEMPEMVSVQLNGSILSLADYATTLLKDGDELEFLYFMGGGSGTAFQDGISL